MAVRRGADPELFDLGNIETTAASRLAFERVYGVYASLQRARLIARHRSGDWGYVNAEGAAQNDYALDHGLALLSSFRLTDGAAIWIVTNGDRTVTSVLLAEELAGAEGDAAPMAGFLDQASSRPILSSFDNAVPTPARPEQPPASHSTVGRLLAW